MAHYAFLDQNNIVTEVIVGKDEGEERVDWEAHYGAFRGQPCKRTSYNTYGGVHSNGGTPFRKNYAGIGYTYDAGRDSFIPPKPYNSWVLVEETCQWKAPVDYPETYTQGLTDEQGNPAKDRYYWNENKVNWELI
jgi:hypothetical protein